MQKFCSRCGSSVQEDLRFCKTCGAPLDDAGTRKETEVNQKPDTAGKAGLRKKLPLIAAVLILLFLAVLVLTGYLFTQSSLSVQSDPPGAGVYLDAEFRGITPSIMHNLMPGEHHLEFRLDGYPPWRKNVTVTLGRAEIITADLSDNLIPEIRVSCFSEEMLPNPSGGTACIYKKGETLTFSGTAVRPHPEENPDATLSIYSQGTGSPLKTQLVAIRPDNSYNLTVDSTTVPSGNYHMVASLPSGQNSTVWFTIESQDNTNLRILQQIVEDYHKIHTYSLEDYFVCADMAQDVWNIVETRGMRAVLVAGNLKNPDVDWKEYNHAWVIVEAAPRQWVALETTGGFLVYKNDNPNYFRGTFFANPKDLKTNMDLRRDYNNELVRYKTAVTQYNAKVTEYNTELDNYHSLLNSYNTRYTGQNLTATEYQESLEVKNAISSRLQKLNQLKAELDHLTITYTNEKQVMDSITTRIEELAAKGVALMNS